MARMPRLVLAGHAHHVIQRGHGERPVFVDGEDRAAYLAALREAAATEEVSVHAWALLEREVQLLATPAEAAGLGRMMQALGRRYVSAYHRRHGSRGTLWDGRFRCAVVEPGATRLTVLRLIDGLAPEPGLTSAPQRTGGARDGWLRDPPEVWHLGNTPFEREAAYGALLAEGLPADTAAALRRAALGGWVSGSAAFAASVAALTSRPARPRAKGRPRRA
jgi:putative transposase